MANSNEYPNSHHLVENSHHTFWFIVRVGFATLAVWVAISDPWDANNDDTVSIHEMLLLSVRFLAFPLHLLLSFTPSPALHSVGLPDAYWPSSAILAIVISLPLWGLLLIGGLIMEAWLERPLKIPPQRLDA